MKIDLHCHTKQIKSGDGSGRNVTKELFCRKIFDADVKIVAITNHNSFDKEQFCDFKDAVSEIVSYGLVLKLILNSIIILVGI